MRYIGTLILIIWSLVMSAQIGGADYLDLCSRAKASEPEMPLPVINPNRPESSPCTLEDAEDFSLLATADLYDYLLNVEDPYTCVNRIIYGYHSDYSPLIFDDAKVNYIATQINDLAASFDGVTDNGVYAVFTYLSIAGLHAAFYSDQISLSSTTYDAIQTACRTLAANKNINDQHPISLYTMGHMFFAASFEEVAVDSTIIATAKNFLDGFADETYVGQPDFYPYYYCHYYILDVFFRYATDHQNFINEIIAQDEVVGSLANVATNLNINSTTYVHFDDLSNLSVTALTRHAPYPGLRDVVEPALQSVADTYPSSDSRWVIAALSLVENEMDFDLTEEEILGTIEERLLPNNYEFDDGKIIISTPLPYDEIISLYQSITQVKAQFFRMIERDTSFADDTNDTLYVKLYGSRDDYRDFNEILYGVNYPNSGGVYIESFGTFYTYQRTSGGSTYTLEELFRHEYTHYLQGRYLIKGGWGDSPMYDNSRLVWFEEGMAQFFAASTRADGIQALTLIRNTLLSHSEVQDLNTVLSSSYASGNPDAYYIYGAMLWTKLYLNDRDRFLEFLNLIRHGDVDSFDALVDFYKNDVSENDAYVRFVDSLMLQNNIWITPQTSGVLPHDIDPFCLDSIHQEILEIIPDLDITSVTVDIEKRPRQFKVSGQLSVDSPVSNTAETSILINQQLNNFLNSLENSSYNNFEHTTAYYTDVGTGSGSETSVASFHIYGPINDCGPVLTEDIQSEVYGDYALLYAPDFLSIDHQYRYREIGDVTWIEMDTSTLGIDSLVNLNSLLGYEYQLRYECAEDIWSEYSQSKTIQLCPDDINIIVPLIADQTYHAANSLTVSSMIDNNAAIVLKAGQSIEILPQFEILQGSVLEASYDNCRERQ